MYERWVRGPIGHGSETRVTRAGCRTVLVMVPTVTAGARLADVLTLVRGDQRIQTVYTVPDDAWPGASDFASACGGLVIPWHQAVNHRFDLVLAASQIGVDRVNGRIMVLPHGAGNLMSRKYFALAGSTAAPHTGLARETLTRQGRLIPAALALTHDNETRVLRRTCPEALPVAVVAGDICYDRMIASVPKYAEYRRALGIDADQKLITVSSTWSTDSVFGQQPELCHRLVQEASAAGSRVALVLHPNVWAAHGRWQVSSWLADCVDDGLLIVPPEEGWRATMVASDYVIGDYGSTTQYAAAIGKRVALATFPRNKIRSGSIADRLASSALRLDLRHPLLPQLGQARKHKRRIAAQVTSRPGQAATILRRMIYQSIELPEPEHQAKLFPVPLPSLVTT
ncbi:hypothetical protein AOZ06_47210 [Kibdelosporangium phytohabitans]|uniref:Uncharacterized protein n=2 Tax=Kibdelosporangium phytohabitans TaxID=860235 RepID=A0A0N9IDQ0_9PSEU|nr:hypothetical protein AOZ06_47210 [Kibdelosporangium phytohabitans]